MKLSVVTINFNNAEGLERTLNSVLAQTYEEFEHIIIDGASTDNSIKVIKEYIARTKELKSDRISDLWRTVVWVSEKDNGIYNAMNKGIRKAVGDYVWILNSGDCVASPTVIAQMMQVLEMHPSCPVLMGNIVHVYENRTRKTEKRKEVAADLRPQAIDASMLSFYSGTIPHDAAFVRRDMFDKFGYFDETMKICADWKLYLDMIALGGIVPMYVDVDVVLFDMTGISNVNNELRLQERRAYLEKVLHPSILKDYDRYADDIRLMQRLHRHLWAYRMTHFLERVLFKLEKWGLSKSEQ